MMALVRTVNGVNVDDDYDHMLHPILVAAVLHADGSNNRSGLPDWPTRACTGSGAVGGADLEAAEPGMPSRPAGDASRA